MADQQYIDRIEEDGIVYIFTDSENRQRVVELNKLIESLKGDLNSKINEEVERAIEQEQILDNSKLDKELGKGLSSNDFTDEYKNAINSLADLKANKTDVESAISGLNERKADKSALDNKADVTALNGVSGVANTAKSTA